MNLTFGVLNVGDIFQLRPGAPRRIKVSNTQHKFENDDTDGSLDTCPAGMSVQRLYNAGATKGEFRFDDLPLLTFFRVEGQDTVHRKSTSLMAIRSSDGKEIVVKRFDRVRRCTEPLAQLAALFPQTVAVMTSPAPVQAAPALPKTKPDQTVFRYLAVGDTFTFFGDDIFKPGAVGMPGRPPIRIPECYKGRTFVKTREVACEVDGSPNDGQFSAPARAVVIRVGKTKVKAKVDDDVQVGQTAFRFIGLGEAFEIVEANWGDETVAPRGNKPGTIARALKGVTMVKTAGDKARGLGLTDEIVLIGATRVNRREYALAVPAPMADIQKEVRDSTAGLAPQPNVQPLSFTVDFAFPKNSDDRIRVKFRGDDGRELVLDPEDAIKHGETMIAYGQKALKATKTLVMA